jgi:hypothetical protein
VAQTILDSKGIGHRTARYEHQLSQDDGRNCAALIQIECKTIRNSLDDKTKTAPDPPRSKKPCSCANSPRLPRARKDRQGPRDRGIQGRPRVSPAAILLAAPDGTLCLLPLFSGVGPFRLPERSAGLGFGKETADLQQCACRTHALRDRRRCYMQTYTTVLVQSTRRASAHPGAIDRS